MRSVGPTKDKMQKVTHGAIVKKVWKEKRMSQQHLWQQRTICSVRCQHADACSAKSRHRGFVTCVAISPLFSETGEWPQATTTAGLRSNAAKYRWFYVLPRVAAFCAAPLWWWWDVHGQCCPPPGWRSKKTKTKQKTGHGVRINDLLVWELLIWSETADKEWDIKPVL